MDIPKPIKMPEYKYQEEDNRSYSVNFGDYALRDKINAVEALMKEQPQVEIKVTHRFSHGVYAREIFIPAGTMLTGEIHKFENLNILSQGDISVMTESGVVRVQAPFTIVSPPGTKRIALAHTDCIWTTIHGTFERNIDKIKNHFVAETEEEYLEHCKKLELKAYKPPEIIKDFY